MVQNSLFFHRSHNKFSSQNTYHNIIPKFRTKEHEQVFKVCNCLAYEKTKKNLLRIKLLYQNCRNFQYWPDGPIYTRKTIVWLFKLCTWDVLTLYITRRNLPAKIYDIAVSYSFYVVYHNYCNLHTRRISNCFLRFTTGHCQKTSS